ncbi:MULTISPECIES: ABC transporter permease [Janibacter]|uniref:ABC transporter permease n=1 Tax=Janibacter hoylei PVAS-1 TaxID=1210046 RepID=K1EUM0_9MICO|nr:ABC transporter permease [Janibacter hoylei]EKA62818.1 dipeptide/oligopeptide/nickel ABC transporter permease [Janibacter hoylei PVAS-1]MCT1618000.1 ABC transporter permease [Janibacter hoylei]MCT2291669.1 ABC transporter permease [Janibacter hoylei]MCW4602437.1 ABC transporter permease [Janibacter hoylei]RWU82093.1 ABC transporter permease [Janibacter hoylei PVAS-1]
MLKFIIRRLLQLVVVLFILSVLLFAWLRALPGGVVSAMLGERATPESRAALTEAFGLDQPLWVQYGKFLSRAVQGDFGVSTAVQPGTQSTEILMTRLPATIELSIVALTIALVLAIPLGYLAARKRASLLDNLSIVGSLIGVAVPVFFLAFLLKYVFAIELGWLPVSGRQEVDATRVTGFFVLDGLLTREWDASWDALKHLILPGIALASIPFAMIFRITRASVLEVLDEDFVRTAQAKGLSHRVVRGRHVMRNALLPVITAVGLQVGALLAGAVLTETVFNFGGIGEALKIAFSERDYPVLQLLVFVAALTYVLVNLLVDILYAVVDPRVRTR